jgi:hypothetical protein
LLSRRKLSLIFLVIAVIIASSTLAVHPARAKVGSTVYFSPDSIAAPATFPSNFVVNITGDTLGSTPTSGINGWDILVTDNDPTQTFLNPISVNTFSNTGGNLLSQFGGESETINCVNNAGTGCTASDGAGLVHTAVSLLAPATPFPVSGLIASITYQAVMTPIVPLNITITAQTISDGSPTPVPVTTRVATYNGIVANFAVSASRPAPFNPGSSISGTVNVTSINSYAKSVTITNDTAPASGLLIHCTALSPNPVVSGGTSTMSCTFTSTLPGIYAVTFNVTDGSLFHLAPMMLRVGDFSMTGTSLPVVFVNGNAAMSTITVHSLSGLAGTIGLRPAIVPASGLTVTCPSSVSLQAGGTAPAACNFSATKGGSYIATVFGFYNFTGTVSGSIVHSFPFIVNVRDFTISASTPVKFIAGSSGGSATITLTPKLGFTGTIALTTSANATGLTVTCGGPISLTTTTTRACTITSSTPGGYNLTITGTCNASPCPTAGLSHSAFVGVAVPFGIQASSVSLVVGQGANANSTLTLTAGNSLAKVVLTLSVSNASITNRPTVLFSNATASNVATLTEGLMPAGTRLVTLTVAAVTSTPTGAYTVNVTSASGSLSFVLQIGITVVNPPSITITSVSVSSTSQTIGQIVNIYVGIMNAGTSSQNFTILVKWGSITVAQKSFVLGAGQTGNYTLAWDTSNYSSGTQSISVTVPPLPNQVNPSPSTVAGPALTLNSSPPPLFSTDEILIIAAVVGAAVIVSLVILLRRRPKKKP